MLIEPNPSEEPNILSIKKNAAAYKYVVHWVHEMPEQAKAAYEKGIFEECCANMKGSKDYLKITGTYKPKPKPERKKTSTSPVIKKLKKKPIKVERRVANKPIKAVKKKTTKTKSKPILTASLVASPSVLIEIASQPTAKIVFNDCMKSALNYSSSIKWVAEQPTLAKLAHKLKIFKDCCGHMSPRKSYKQSLAISLSEK